MNMNFKKIATAFLAGLMAFSCMLPLTSCKNGSTTNGGDTAVTEGEVKVKVLKMGRALSTVIRTESSTVIIDTGDVDHAQDLITFLTEKGITTVDAVVFTNYSKKCIGGMPDLLASGITVKAIYGASYKKDSSSYSLLANALESYKLSVETIGEQKELAFGDLKLNCYPATKDYSTADDENDEGNSMAVAMNYGKNSILFTSRIAGDRLAELTTQIDGKDFDCIIAPNFGAYDDKLPAFLTAAKAESAVVVASNSNPPAEATISALTAAGIDATKIFITRDGSVEISADGTNFTIKQ